jgi:hypothetical protein
MEYFSKLKIEFLMVGDWGLGIAQSPIPNPQKQICIMSLKINFLKNNINFFKN